MASRSDLQSLKIYVVVEVGVPSSATDLGVSKAIAVETPPSSTTSTLAIGVIFFVTQHA